MRKGKRKRANDLLSQHFHMKEGKMKRKQKPKTTFLIYCFKCSYF